MKEASCHHCAPQEVPVHFGRRFLGALLCALPVWWFSMDHSLRGGIVQAFFASVSLFLFGWPLLKRAWESFKRRAWNMFSLIGVGLISSWALSIWRLASPQNAWISGFYFEGTATLVCFVLLGQFFEDKVSKESSKAVEKLLSLVPQVVRRISEVGKEESVSLDQVKKKDFLRVLPGQQVPLDGILTEGESFLDESLMTGESMPVVKKVGDKVLAGTVNGTGTFIFQVSHLEKETELFKIIDLVSKVQNQKIPIQKLADKVSAQFTLWVFAIALLTGIVWGVWGPEPKGMLAVLQAVSVLMIACPCALGLATPISIMVGMRLAAREGVLFRKLEAIQLLEKIQTIVFDKTGTLTEGKPQVVSFFPLGAEIPRQKLLQLAASLESVSEHPLAQSVVHFAKAHGVRDFLPVTGFQAVLGKGATAKIGNEELVIGSEEFLKTLTQDHQEWIEKVEKLRENGETVLLFSMNNKVEALFGVKDPIRKEAKEVIGLLQKRGLHLVLASGDHPKNTELVAKLLGLQDWEGGLSPATKAEKIKKIQDSGHQVAFIGDGINDAPALTQADVGVAMETSTDIAKQSAPVSLLRGGLLAFERTLLLSEAMMKNIRQNLFWAFSYNLVGIPLAAGAFYPFWGIKLTPAFSSFAMTLSSLLVVGNSLRLLKTKYRIAK